MWTRGSCRGPGERGECQEVGGLPPGAGRGGFLLESDTFRFGPRSVRPRDSEEPRPPSEPQIPRLQTAAVTELPEGLLGDGGRACPLGIWHKATAPNTITSLAVGSTGGEGMTFRLAAQRASSNSKATPPTCEQEVWLILQAPVSNTLGLSREQSFFTGPELGADMGGTWPTGYGPASASSQSSG